MAPFDLQLGTPAAKALQDAIEKELANRSFASGEDKVMAEYITIMIVNNKTPAQITAELEEFIGAEIYDPTFTDWLFVEATRITNPGQASVSTSESATAGAAAPSTTAEPTPETQAIPTYTRDDQPRRQPNAGAPRIYNQAISGAQKRTFSNRSPSPSGNGPNKTRRVEAPTGPRADRGRDGGDRQNRSLRDRMGGFANGGGPPNPPGPGPIPQQGPGMIPPGFMPGPMGGPMGMGMPMMPMDGGNGALAEALAQQNQLLQNMMQLMAANQMGVPPMGMPGMLGPGMQGPPGGPGPMPGHDGRGRGHGRGRGRGFGERGGVGRGGAPPHLLEQGVPPNQQQGSTDTQQQSSIPKPATEIPSAAPPSSTPLEPPTRPLSPTLCKFGVKCTNAMCRYSHPSAAATAESGVVLTTEACPQGRGCTDKDCKFSHPSAGTSTKPPAPAPAPVAAPAPTHALSAIPCKFGAHCSRPNCPYLHAKPKSTVPCKFGAACTRPDCHFSHPQKGKPTTGNISMRFNVDAKPFVPKNPPVVPDIAPSSDNPSKETSQTAEGNQSTELVAAI